jgi:predicted esterase
MFGRKLTILLTIIITMNVSLLADWESDLDELLKTDDSVRQAQLIDQVVAANPSWQEVAKLIESQEFLPHRGDELVERWITCLDGVERPYVLYVPKSYNSKEPTPMLVILHGGVGRTKLKPERIEYTKEHEFRWLASENGWLALFPFGQQDATWWDSVGMGNIENQIHLVKREFNIDDDRVWLSGFSDGASASFGHAMLVPPSLDGDLPTYVVNMANTPTYAVTTDRDYLYPSATMRPTIALAQAAGADIRYREHEGGHDFTYADVELPLISEWLQRHPRAPFPSELTWETAALQYGKCRWFAIDAIKPVAAADWHQTFNMTLIDSSITIGFIPDWEYEGPGIRVDRLSDGNYVAPLLGLKAGDLIVGGAGLPIDSIENLDSYKSTLRRGDPTQITVQRGDRELTLSATLPEPEEYLLFNLPEQSALARVTATGNHIAIQGSRLGSFTVLVHPDQFRLEQNLKINVEGEEVYDALVNPDIKFMIRNFLENRDRKLLYVAEVRVSR